MNEEAAHEVVGAHGGRGIGQDLGEGPDLAVPDAHVAPEEEEGLVLVVEGVSHGDPVREPAGLLGPESGGGVVGGDDSAVGVAELVTAEEGDSLEGNWGNVCKSCEIVNKNARMVCH